jgi:hypothetical protein
MNEKQKHVLSFVPFLEKAMQDETLIGTYEYIEPHYSKEVLSFLRAFRDCEDLTDFDYIENFSFDWIENPEMIKDLSLPQIATLLTGIIRQDRFNSGLIWRHIKSGILLKALLRLKELWA